MKLREKMRSAYRALQGMICQPSMPSINANNNPAELKAALLKLRTSTDGCNQHKALEAVIAAANTHKPDILIGPEWLFYSGKKPYKRDEKESLLRNITNNVPNETLVIPGTFVWAENHKLYNSASIIYNGRIMLEYFKCINGGDDKIAMKHGCEFHPGNKDGAVFKWNKLAVGLEICADNSSGLLSKNKNAKCLDIQVLVECSYGNIGSGPQLAEGGYFLICNGGGGGDPATKVKQKNTDGLNDVDVSLVRSEKNVDIYALKLQSG